MTKAPTGKYGKQPTVNRNTTIGFFEKNIKSNQNKRKGKNLKPVDKTKNPGLAKLPIEVRNKMGYARKGGRA